MSENKNVVRLQQLSRLMQAVSHARGGQARSEMILYLAEFDSIKNSYRDDWDEFCKERDASY